MNEEAVRVEFALPPSKQPPAPQLAPEFKAERLRRLRATKRARQLALAHWIEGLIRSGEVEDLATVARLCGISRARVSKIASLAGTGAKEQERILGLPQPFPATSPPPLATSHRWSTIPERHATEPSQRTRHRE